MSCTLKRFNSGGPSNVEPASIIKAGNLGGFLTPFVEAHSDDDISEDEFLDCDSEITYDYNEIRMEDFKAADQVMEKVFGIPIIENFTKLILKGKISAEDIVVQALSYIVVKKIRGPTGVRYQESYGMFWAAIRNIIKTSGLVPFMDHFLIPSALSKFKRKLIDLCCLKEEEIGKPGLQEQNIKAWIGGMVKEKKCEKLCVSLCMDGKKIHMSNDGFEDMGNESESKSCAEEESMLNDLLAKNDRPSLFSAFDYLTFLCQEIYAKLEGIKSLIKRNTRNAEKKPHLLRYVHVLTEQCNRGNVLLDDLGKLHRSILHSVCRLRKTSHLLPENGIIDFTYQSNFLSLKDLTVEEEDVSMEVIETVDYEEVVTFPWSSCQVARPFSYIPHTSAVFQNIERRCVLISDHIFKSCGLGSTSPLQDMKETYRRSRVKLQEGSQYKPSSKRILATLSSMIVPMIFGNNCYIADAGIFVDNGFCSMPSSLVFDNNDILQYVVRAVCNEENPFKLTNEIMSMCVLDSELTHSHKGCLLLQYSEKFCVVYSIPRSQDLSDEMVSLVKEYLASEKIITRRSKEMLLRINSLRTSIMKHAECCSILGSFPLVDSVRFSVSSLIEEGNFYLKGSSIKAVLSSECDFTYLKQDIKETLKDKVNFLSKRARELIVINASDMSGIDSAKLPHTQVCATFLTASSLKTVGRQCLSQAEALINKHGAEVMNIGVDGESLHLVTKSSQGSPGTVLALVKSLMTLLKTLPKEYFVSSMSRMKNLKFQEYEDDDDHADEEEDDNNVAFENEDFEQSIAVECQRILEPDWEYNVDNIHELIRSELSSEDSSKVNWLKGMKLSDLRILCLKQILPLAKKAWLERAIGSDHFLIKFR